MEINMGPGSGNSGKKDVSARNKWRNKTICIVLNSIIKQYQG